LEFLWLDDEKCQIQVLAFKNNAIYYVVSRSRMRIFCACPFAWQKNLAAI